MRNILIGAAALTTTVAVPAAAQHAFDGTWKVDVASAQMPAKPFGWTIAGGRFTCVTCSVPYTVASDGAFHKVVGQPYWDETAVAIVDPMTVRQSWRRAGKLIETTTSTVAADGTSYSYTDIDMSAPNGQSQTSTGSNMRVTRGAPGSHALAGTWRTGKLTSIPDDALTLSFQSAGRDVTMTTPLGYHYTATIGGPAVLVQGDQAGTMAALTMPNPSTLVETDSRDGKPVMVMTFVAKPDGTLAITAEDTRQATTARYTAMKR